MWAQVYITMSQVVIYVTTTWIPAAGSGVTLNYAQLCSFPPPLQHPIHSLHPNKTDSLMPLNINAPDLNNSACPHLSLAAVLSCTASSPRPTKAVGEDTDVQSEPAYGQCMRSEASAPCGPYAASVCLLGPLTSSVNVLSLHLNGHSVSDSLNTSA